MATSVEGFRVLQVGSTDGGNGTVCGQNQAFKDLSYGMSSGIMMIAEAATIYSDAVLMAIA